jgi:hypothetical protein
MDGVFEVQPYSLDWFTDLLVRSSQADIADVRANLHLSYFDGYLNEIGVSTIVAEYEYVDHDYLEDYAEYYVKCFQQYNRKCLRIHFFSNSFQEEDICNLLIGRETPISQGFLNEGYLGFIVVKPLPQTIFGRTCIRTYAGNRSRHFPITRTYQVNLFGLGLEVSSSLAFQEQDKAVAACATSALWSVFQGTGKLFQHSIPSPSEITKAATENTAKDNRAFPSCGLSSYEMARAIRRVGLEPELVRVSDYYLLKCTIYAYLRAKIPMIFGVRVYNNDPTDGLSFTGAHAVAVTGYCISQSAPQPFGLTNFRLRANSIDKIYVHDDQIGPFSRMDFGGNEVSEGGQLCEALSLSWHNRNGLGVPDILLIPLYNKIRIPFGTIHDEVLQLDRLVTLALQAGEVISQGEGVEWDVYLTTVNDLKESVLSSTCVNHEMREIILFMNMPKYIWRSTAYINDSKVVDLLFDATDLEQGSMFYDGIAYDHPAVTYLVNQLKGVDLAALPVSATVRKAFEWLSKILINNK